MPDFVVYRVNTWGPEIEKQDAVIITAEDRHEAKKLFEEQYGVLPFFGIERVQISEFHTPEQLHELTGIPVSEIHMHKAFSTIDGIASGDKSIFESIKGIGQRMGNYLGNP
jgi:hypothetical protein